MFKPDLDFNKLERHLGVLVDAVYQSLPQVKKVDSIRTVCEAMELPPFKLKDMLSEVDKLLKAFSH